MVYKEIIIITIIDNSNNRTKNREEKEKIKSFSNKSHFVFCHSQPFENASNFLLVIAMQIFLMSVKKHLEAYSGIWT